MATSYLMMTMYQRNQGISRHSIDITHQEYSRFWCMIFHVIRSAMTKKHFPHYWPCLKGIHCVFPNKGPAMWSFDVFIVVSLNKLLKRQSSCQSFDTYLCHVTLLQWPITKYIEFLITVEKADDLHRWRIILAWQTAALSRIVSVIEGHLSAPLILPWQWKFSSWCGLVVSHHFVYILGNKNIYLHFVTKWTRTSATMILTYLSGNVSVSAPESWTHIGLNRIAAMLPTTFLYCS